MKRSISIFGATGSVGDQTLDIVRRYKDSWQVDVLTAKKSVKKLSDAAKEFGAKVAVIFDESRLEELREALSGTETLVTSGSNALIDAAARPVDITMGAIVGCVGLPPLMRTIERGGTVALANKEALVSAGTVMTEAVKKYGAKLLPVDSEHNAIFQCLQGNDLSDVERITLTASGGPLRQCSLAELKNAAPNQAIAHPNWDMGAKISVDSATMMNKGLEYIEAFHLFPVGLDRLKIVVHPQSIVHSMVEYRDKSTLAQMGPSDMRVPISFCLGFPKRIKNPMGSLNLEEIGELSFFPLDEVRFPATRLAREAIKAGGGASAILNAANEIAVAAFLEGQIGFTNIAEVVEEALCKYSVPTATQLDDVMAIDCEARNIANSILEKFAC
jgi:1-deoxy-D-xylulose-5-phosphate reductoisomerase